MIVYLGFHHIVLENTGLFFLGIVCHYVVLTLIRFYWLISPVMTYAQQDILTQNINPLSERTL